MALFFEKLFTLEFKSDLARTASLILKVFLTLWFPSEHKIRLVQVLREHEGILPLLMRLRFELKGESETGANSFGWLERDLSIKFLNDEFRNHQAKAYTVDVQILIVLNETKKLE